MVNIIETLDARGKIVQVNQQDKPELLAKLQGRTQKEFQEKCKDVIAKKERDQEGKGRKIPAHPGANLDE